MILQQNEELHESLDLGLFTAISPLSKTVPRTHVNMLSEWVSIPEIRIRKEAQPISYHSRRKTSPRQLVEK